MIAGVGENSPKLTDFIVWNQTMICDLINHKTCLRYKLTGVAVGSNYSKLTGQVYNFELRDLRYECKNAFSRFIKKRLVWSHLRSFLTFALRILTAHNLWRH